MNKCLNCGVEIESKGTKPKKYCSDACRMVYKRTEQMSKRTSEHPARIMYLDIEVKDLTAAQITAAIDSYPQDTWKDSLEYEELMHRLRTMSIKELVDKGHSIPAWKRKEEAA